MRNTPRFFRDMWKCPVLKRWSSYGMSVLRSFTVLIFPRGYMTVEIACALVPNKRVVLIVGDREFSVNLINQRNGGSKKAKGGNWEIHI